MRTIQEHFKGLDKERLIGEYMYENPLHLHDLTESDLKPAEIMEWYKAKLSGYIDRLSTIGIRGCNDGQEGYLFAYRTIEDDYPDVTYGLVFKDELIRYGCRAHTYAFDFTDQAEVMGYLVADTDLTQDNIYGLAVHVMEELSFFGYGQEHLEEEKEELGRRIQEIKDGKAELHSWEEVKAELGMDGIFERTKETPGEKALWHKASDAMMEYTGYSVHLEINKLMDHIGIERHIPLIGAAIGDMAGNPFEFKKFKSKEFKMLETGRYTDDTVMTAAIASAIMDRETDRTNDYTPSLEQYAAREMHRMGNYHLGCGYGKMFFHWLEQDDPKPYGSFGNGSAMRVSAVGWTCDTVEETRELARMTAMPTHGHPEGIKGAESVASAIFLARTGSSKEDIRSYIEKEFGYDLHRSCDDIRPRYKFKVSCQESVPEAIIAFLDAVDFEDAIRNAVSLGGDADTQAAIAGSIAEAYYPVPEHLIQKCMSRLPEDIREPLETFGRFKKPCTRYEE